MVKKGKNKVMKDKKNNKVVNIDDKRTISQFINETVKQWITDDKWLKKPTAEGEDNELQ